MQAKTGRTVYLMSFTELHCQNIACCETLYMITKFAARISREQNLSKELRNGKPRKKCEVANDDNILLPYPKNMGNPNHAVVFEVFVHSL